MALLHNYFARFMSLFEESDKNPFEDGSDFESFIPSQYMDIAKGILAKTNLDVPLNLYKFVLVKVNPFFTATELKDNQLVFKKTLSKVKEAKNKYAVFEQKNISMTPKERKYVKSAHATLLFAEMALTVAGISSEIELKKLHEIYLGNPESIQNFYQICSDILEGNNPIAEGLVEYGALLRNYLSKNHFNQVLHFILCMLAEALKRSKKNRVDQGLIAENPWMKRAMSRIETRLRFYKMSYLGFLLTTSGALMTIGSDPDLETVKSDEEIAKKLMKLLENCEKQDKFHKVPILVKTYEEAKDVYAFILKLASQLEDSEFHKRMYDQENLEGICQSYMAAFTTDPDEIYRLSETSLELLNEIVENIEDSPLEYELLMEAIDENLRRIWTFKYDKYQQDKTPENLKDLKKVASKRILWAKKNLVNMNDVVGVFPDWWVLFDWFKCILQVFEDLVCATKLVIAIQEVLTNSPENIPNFIRHTGIEFDLSLNKNVFMKMLLDKFKPNDDVCFRNPFEDKNDLYNFVSIWYNYQLPEKFFDDADLTVPFNIYKYLLIKLLHTKDRADAEIDEISVILETLQDLKQKYKQFIDRGISMTAEERKIVRTAHATLKLAELYFKSYAETEKFEIKDFDFHKLKNVCSVILNGYAEEVPIVYLLALFQEMWKINHTEVCRFLLCVMTEILKKTQAIRIKNDTFATNCPCLGETITEFIIMEVNKASLLFLNRVLVNSNYSCALNTSELPKSKQIRNGETLMQIFENYEGQEEFQEIPRKVETYDQAKMIFESIMKLVNERKARNTKQTAYESNYFEGMACCNFAAFVPNPKEINKLCEKSITLLQDCLNIKQPVGELRMKIKVFKAGPMICAIDENYRRIWNSKFKIYKQDKSEKNQLDLKHAVSKRVEWSKKTLAKPDGGYWPFGKWWTHLDLIKCHLKVSKDETAAGKSAEDLHKELLGDTAIAKMFSNIVGIEFDSAMCKEDFVPILIQKLK